MSDCKYKGFCYPLNFRVFLCSFLFYCIAVLGLIAYWCLKDRIYFLFLFTLCVLLMLAWYIVGICFRRYMIADDAIYLAHTIFVWKMQKYLWRDISEIQMRKLFVSYPFPSVEKYDAGYDCILLFTHLGLSSKEYCDLPRSMDKKIGYMASRQHLICILFNEELMRFLGEKTGFFHIK